MLNYKINQDMNYIIDWLDLHQKWNDRLIPILEKNRELGLYLSCDHAWTDNDLYFLKKVPWLKYLYINELYKIDLSLISELNELLYLKIHIWDRAKIDFSHLNKLKVCSIEKWCSGFNNMFECQNISYLYIDGYTGKSFGKISSLQNLKKLSIFYPAFSDFDGINNLKKLKKLRIVGQRIQSIEHLGQSMKIEELEIENCKRIPNIESLKKLDKLRYLLLDNLGDIPSLTPISSCLNLEILGVRGSTNVLDGDIGFLLKMPNLKMVGLSDRNHYSHKHKDFLHLRPDNENWRKLPKKIKL